MRYIKFTYITTVLLIGSGLASAGIHVLDNGATKSIRSTRFSRQDEELFDGGKTTIDGLERHFQGRDWRYSAEKQGVGVNVKNNPNSVIYEFSTPEIDPTTGRPTNRKLHVPKSFTDLAMIDLKLDVVNKNHTTTSVKLNSGNQGYRLFDPFEFATGKKTYSLDLSHSTREQLYTDSLARFDADAITSIEFIFEGAKKENGHYKYTGGKRSADNFVLRNIKMRSADDINTGNHGNVASINDEAEILGDNTNTQAVPEPFSMITMGSGLLGFLRRRKLK